MNEEMNVVIEPVSTQSDNGLDMQQTTSNNEQVSTPASDQASAGSASQSATQASTQTPMISTMQSFKSIFYRHPTDKVLGGVCGGLADYSGFDPLLVRALWVIATLITGGGGFIAYVALWLLLPVGSKAGGYVKPAAIEMNESNLGRAATVLIGLGVLWLLANVGILPALTSMFFSFTRILFWPLLLIGAGYLLLQRNGKEIKLNMNLNDISSRLRNEGDKLRGESSKWGEKVDLKGGFRNFRQSFPIKRSRRDKMLMGVCGGIAQKLGIDANLVRLVWAAFTIGGAGTPVLLYVLVGLFLPQEDGLMPATTTAVNEPVDVKIIDGSATTMI